MARKKISLTKKSFINTFSSWYKADSPNMSDAKVKEKAESVWNHMEKRKANGRNKIEVVKDRPDNALTNASQTSPAGFQEYPERKSLFSSEGRTYYYVPLPSLWDAFNKKTKRKSTGAKRRASTKKSTGRTGG